MLITVLGMVCLVAVATAGAPTNLNVDMLTYLGDSGGGVTSVGGTAVDSQGRVYVGGSGTFNFGKTPVVISGGKNGFILRLTSSGAVDGVWRYGNAVTSIRSRDVNGAVKILVQGDFGISVFDEDFHQQWTYAMDCSGSHCRSDLATDGTVAVLEMSGQLHQLDTSGHQVAVTQVSSSVSFHDTAVDPRHKLVLVSYHIQSRPHHVPVQVPCLVAYHFGLQSKAWTDYCVSGEEDYDTQNMADSRALGLYYNDDDGLLYFSGYTDGGNSVFRYQPLDIQHNNGKLKGLHIMDKTHLVGYDSYTQTYNMHGAHTISFVGQLDPSNGALQHGQFVLTRLSNGNGNSLGTKAIAAGRQGHIFLAQTAAFAIENRDKLTLNGKPVARYGGDGVLLALPGTMTSRLIWHAFTETAGHTDVVDVAAKPTTGGSKVALVLSGKSPARFHQIHGLPGTGPASGSDTQFALVLLTLPDSLDTHVVG